MGGIVRKVKKDQLGNGGEVEEQSSIPPVEDKCHPSLFMPEKIQSTIQKQNSKTYTTIS